MKWILLYFLNFSTLACFEIVTFGVFDKTVLGLFLVIWESLLGVSVRFLFVGVSLFVNFGVTGVLDLNNLGITSSDGSFDPGGSATRVLRELLPSTDLILLVSFIWVVLLDTLVSMMFSLASIAFTRCWTPKEAGLFFIFCNFFGLL